MRLRTRPLIIERMASTSSLRAIPLFAGLSEEALADVARRLRRRAYAEGEIILQCGDAPSEMHIVAEGAVRVELGEATSRAVKRVILFAGHSFGEMSLLSGNPVSATVVAHTESTTLAISAEDLAAVLERHPSLYRRISELLIERLRHRTQVLASELKPGLAVIAVDAESPLHSKAVRAIAGGVRHYCPGSPFMDARQSGGEAVGVRIERWRREGAADQFFVAAIPVDRFADVRSFLLPGDAVIHITGPDTVLGSDERIDAGSADAKTLMVDTQAPSRSSPWIESVTSRELAQYAEEGKWTRTRYPALDRMARFITRREVGVAMSVGAAAGFAHLGFLQVLEECAVPVDFVCGSSMGGLVALGFAQFGVASKAADSLCRLGAAFAKSRGLQVVPRAGLVSARRIQQIAHEMFGDLTFADLTLPAAVVAADLVAGERVILDRGPVAEAARATIAIPGIFPPVRIGHRILVDGGLVARVPADLLARRRCGLRIAAVVLPQRSTPQQVEAEADRLHRRLEQPFGFRAALAASWRMLGWWDSAAHAGTTDLLLRIATPPREDYDFAAGRQMLEVGRQATLDQVGAIQDATRRLLDPGSP